MMGDHDGITYALGKGELTVCLGWDLFTNVCTTQSPPWFFGIKTTPQLATPKETKRVQAWTCAAPQSERMKRRQSS